MNSLTLHTGKNDSPGHLPGAKLCRVQISWNINNKNCVWQAGKFNTRCFEWLKKQVVAANNSGMRAQIIIASTPLLRMPEWGNHALNSKNGGPITAKGSAVREFYSNGKAIQIIMALLRKISTSLKEQDIEIYLCWENFSSWNYGGADWAAEMCIFWKYKKHLGDFRPIGTGVVKYSHLKELNSVAGPGIKGNVEAWHYGKFIRENWLYFLSRKLFKLLWQWVGFWPWSGLFYEQKNWKKKEAYFYRNEIRNAIQELKQIYKMIIHGAGASYHFDVLLESGYWEKKYGFSIPKSYSINKHMNAIKGYLSIPVIRKAAQNPESMKSKEHRRLFKAVSREYLEKLRNEN
jgi:hypothetical protein